MNMLIKKASNKFEKFIIVQPTYRDVLDFNNWYPEFYKKTYISEESYGKTVPKSEKASIRI